MEKKDIKRKSNRLYLIERELANQGRDICPMCHKHTPIIQSSERLVDSDGDGCCFDLYTCTVCHTQWRSDAYSLPEIEQK